MIASTAESSRQAKFGAFPHPFHGAHISVALGKLSLNCCTGYCCLPPAPVSTCLRARNLHFPRFFSHSKQAPHTRGCLADWPGDLSLGKLHYAALKTGGGCVTKGVLKLLLLLLRLSPHLRSKVPPISPAQSKAFPVLLNSSQAYNAHASSWPHFVAN